MLLLLCVRLDAAHVCLASSALLLGATNQIHKWLHQARPACCVRALQRARMILPRETHREHHRAAHDRYYCITTGWCNAPLERIGFWRALETSVTYCTGARPRET